MTEEELWGFLASFEERGLDVDRFVNYTQRIVSQAIKETPPREETQLRGRLNGGRLFLNKSFELVQTIINCGRKREPFQLLVLLKSLFRRGHTRVSTLRLVEQHKVLDKVIRAFASEQKNLRAMMNASLDSPAGDFVNLEGLTWRRGYLFADTHEVVYWGYASAARTLRTAYLDQLCCTRTGKGQTRHPDWDPATKTCFHTNSKALLDWLQTKAWSEIRGNVFRTLGTVFAAELTEQIFGYALEAEDVPAHPRVSEGFLVQPLQWKIEKQQELNCPPPPPRECRRTKAIYKCCHIDDPDPERMFGPHANDIAHLDDEFFRPHGG